MECLKHGMYSRACVCEKCCKELEEDGYECRRIGEKKNEKNKTNRI